VSGLESLAGARAADDVEVHLKNAVYSEGSLYINDEPVKSVKDRITIIGLSRHDWKSHFDNPLGTRDPGSAAQAVLTLLSLKTVFPRDAHDNIMFLGANKQYSMWSVISSICGGRLSEFWPLAPNSLITK
jgi:predicted Abi (CAAX) family protease